MSLSDFSLVLLVQLARNSQFLSPLIRRQYLASGFPGVSRLNHYPIQAGIAASVRFPDGNREVPIHHEDGLGDFEKVARSCIDCFVASFYALD